MGRRSLTVDIAWRFLTGRRSRLLSGTAWSALGAVAVGVLAMVVAMALMTGYREDLESKLIRGNAAVAVVPLGAAEADSHEIVARLSEVPGTEVVSVVSYAQGTLSLDGVTREVTFRGVDPGTPADLSGGALRSDDGLPALALGEDLATRLGVGAGEVLRLSVLGFRDGRPRFAFRSVRVAATFRTGFAEFDQAWAVVDRGLLESLTGLGAEGRIYEIGLTDPRRAQQVARQLRDDLGEEFVVTEWRELNRELFTALRLQQVALFLILGLIVLVSTFNVGSTLVVLIRERMRELGVLAAMGLRRSALRRVVLVYGLALGCAGTLVGLLVGGAVTYALDRYDLIRFDAEVAAIYFIQAVPFRLSLTDVAAIGLFTLLVTLVACWAPSRRAARIRPADALRYE